MTSLFEKYGYATISQIVKSFYKEILDRPSLSHFFVNTDIHKLIEHQTNFISVILGGPSLYNGRNIKAAHAKLAITNDSFNEVASILHTILTDVGMESADIKTVMEIVENTRKEIVSVE